MPGMKGDIPVENMFHSFCLFWADFITKQRNYIKASVEIKSKTFSKQENVWRGRGEEATQIRAREHGDTNPAAEEKKTVA